MVRDKQTLVQFPYLSFLCSFFCQLALLKIEERPELPFINRQGKGNVPTMVARWPVTDGQWV